MSSFVLVGCAGWSLPSNVAGLFPTEGSHLERYARVFSCAEINSSFYRSHQPGTYARWADSVPDGFRFSVKAPRAMTHEQHLKDCRALLDVFLEETAPLGKKLGAILVQLPPSLALDVRTATRFFSLLRDRTPVQVVCEPRHPSWFTLRAESILKKVGVACVRAHPVATRDMETFPEASGADYIRLHGAPDMYYSAYDDTFLDAVATQIRLARDRGRQVWCIFDNTARGAAVPNALSLMERLEMGLRQEQGD